MSNLPCSGTVGRRDFLRVGLGGLAGLSFSHLLANQAGAGQAGPPTSVILFWMWGGPSQHETFDPKPDAPAEYRGPFGPIRTKVPGIAVCELFPALAKLADRFALVRSLHHTMASHNDGSIEVLTGKTPARPDPTSTAVSQHPDFGMIASRARGARPDGLPQYVGIPNQPFMTRPAYLGLSYQALNTGNPAAPTYSPPNLARTAAVGAARFEERRFLLEQFDSLRRDIDYRGGLEGADKLRASALRMLTNAGIARAFDLGLEHPRVRDRYGRHLWGQSCLLARRLAAAGAAVITIDALAPEQGKPLYFSWDDHANAQPGWDLARGMRWRAPFMDQALSALLDDIACRGLDKHVLVLALGEFGRTPRLTRANGCLGRDHWPDVQSALVAGGGLRLGQVVGASDSKGAYPKERPLTPQDLLATVYRHLGIDYRAELKDLTGRPIAILGTGEPIRELV